MQNNSCSRWLCCLDWIFFLSVYTLMKIDGILNFFFMQIKIVFCCCCCRANSTIIFNYSKISIVDSVYNFFFVRLLLTQDIKSESFLSFFLHKNFNLQIDLTNTTEQTKKLWIQINYFKNSLFSQIKENVTIVFLINTKKNFNQNQAKRDSSSYFITLFIYFFRSTQTFRLKIEIHWDQSSNMSDFP